MRWHPNDWILLLGIVICALAVGEGGWLIAKGVEGGGSIDVKSVFMSGSLKTGSAGVLIVAVAFMMMAFIVHVAMKRPVSYDSTNAHPPERGRVKKLAPFFFALLLAALLTGAGAAFSESMRAPLGILCVLLCGLLVVVTVVIANMISYE